MIIGAGGLGHIGIQCLAELTAHDHHRGGPQPGRAEAGRRSSARTTPWWRDGSQVDAVKDLTGGQGAHVVLDFVAEQGAEMDGWNMTRPAGSYYVIGYGGTLTIPTLDIISTERNIIGNIVGTYNELVELMVLAQSGQGHPAHQDLPARRRARRVRRPRRRPGTRPRHPRPLGVIHGQGTALRR